MAWGVLPTLVGAGIAGIGRGFTPELWDGCDPQAILRDPSLGHFYQTTFIDGPIFAAASAAGSVSGAWNGYTDATAGTKIGGAGLQGGGTKLESTTIAEMASMQFGATAGRPFVFSTADEDDTWPYHHTSRIRAEWRFALGSVTNSAPGIFMGFSGVLAALDLDNSTGDVVNSKNFVGFHVLAAAGATLRFIFQAAADTAPTVVIASVATMAINKWYRAGIDFNPLAKSNERLSIWFDGVKQSSFVTAGTVAGATFPKSTDSTQVFLSPSFMCKSADGNDTSLYLSGFRVFGEPLVAAGNEASA